MPEKQLVGEVTLEVVRHSTGGEYSAVVLTPTEGERVILQRRGGNPFNDPPTLALVGHKVLVSGFRIEGGIFRFTAAENLD